MTEKTNELLRNFNRIDKEFNDIYHEVALKMGISDSAFSIFYILHDLGDGCLQKDICYEAFANKQTVNSSIRKLEREGYLYFKTWTGTGQTHFSYRNRQTIRGKIYRSGSAEGKRSLHSAAAEEQEECCSLTKIYTKA